MNNLSYGAFLRTYITKCYCNYKYLLSCVSIYRDNSSLAKHAQLMLLLLLLLMPLLLMLFLLLIILILLLLLLPLLLLYLAASLSAPPGTGTQDSSIHSGFSKLSSYLEDQDGSQVSVLNQVNSQEFMLSASGAGSSQVAPTVTSSINTVPPNLAGSYYVVNYCQVFFWITLYNAN